MGSAKCLGWSVFRGSRQNFTIVVALKFGVIFSKIFIKISNTIKNYEEISEKCKYLTKTFLIAGGVEAILGVRGRSPLKQEIFIIILSKTAIVKVTKFQEFSQIFSQICKQEISQNFLLRKGVGGGAKP